MNIMKKGFTLVELFIVISIIAVLATLAIVALNPVKRFQDTRNAKRWNDVDAVAAAVQQYVVDMDGALPVGISSVTASQLGSCPLPTGDDLCPGAATTCLDLSAALSTYLKQLPYDPVVGVATMTGYTIIKDVNNFVTVAACAPEGGEVISVSR